ncbi:unnamed protein product [Coffea canephora]|uniref:Protein kinase domain-containing protein n=1 Tax=Coffea canephora TaxID=49390 RepID=A0A068UNL7_COFCA|nr:unnamed protein product [Coffea canephora]
MSMSPLKAQRIMLTYRLKRKHLYQLLSCHSKRQLHLLKCLLHLWMTETAKMLDVSSEPKSNFEFLTQVSLYALWLKLENLVELLGYCVQVNLCVVAYDFATMGSLCDILHSKKIDTSSSECGSVLSCTIGPRITVHVARGLEYLHEKVLPAIIHGVSDPAIWLCSKIMEQRFQILTFPIRLLTWLTHLHSTRVLGTFCYHVPT